MFVNYVKLLRLGLASVKQSLHKIIFSLRPIQEKKIAKHPSSRNVFNKANLRE